MADEFARLGHTVYGCARTRNEISELSLQYPHHDFQAVDVASDSEVESWAQRLLLKHSAPDFVLNNAAVVNQKALLWELGDSEFARAIDTNDNGVTNVIRHFAPSMIKRKKGIIVNFISRWGKRCERQMAPYCATKWAVVAITKVLAEDLRGMGIAAVGLNPGVVNTPMLQSYFGPLYESRAAEYPSPVEWARVAVPLILGLRLRDSGKMREVVLTRVGKSTNREPGR